MILKSETYRFHRLDLTRQAGFIVTIYDEDGLRLASTPSADTGCLLRTRRARSSTTRTRAAFIIHCLHGLAPSERMSQHG
jgi:hypothetical protein